MHYHQFPLIVLISALAPAVAFPQSLADVAQKAEEQRQTSKQPSKVYTNEDLKRSPIDAAPLPPANAAPASIETKPSTQTAGQPPKADSRDPASPGPKDQKYWTDRMTEARAQLGRSKLLLDAVQTRINSLSSDIVNRHDPAQRAVLERNRQDAVRELNRLKKEIQDQHKSITDIEEEARRAGVPPGWLR